MRRIALLLAGGALWLILAALPALADGGPHTSTINNGSAGINADSCAGCHRAHTAQGPYLIKEATEEELCLSCHGAAVNGSTVDVITGIQYRLGTGSYVRDGDYTTPGDPQTPWLNGAQLGATRGGGFVLARMGDAARVATSTGGGLRATVPVGSAEAVNSAHLDLDGVGGVEANGIAWGNGNNGSGAGPAVQLSCASCHNPHGNGQYRILNPVPAPVDLSGGNFLSKTPVPIAFSHADANLIQTTRAHNLSLGDRIAITGHAAALNNATGTFWVVVEVPSGISFRIGASLTNPIAPIDITVDTGAGGSLTWFDHKVTDAPLPGAGDTRNYTVIQKPGTQGIDATYLLFASQVAGSGNHRDIIGIASSSAGTDEFTTASAHGLTVGDSVTVEFHNAVTTPAAASGVLAATVASTPTATTFTLTGVDITTGGTAFGVLTRTYSAAYAPTDGDYFHRTSPWYYTSGQGDDAPNGHPATNPAGLAAGDVAFETQMAAWCSSCHTRYWTNQNPNPGEEPGSSAFSTKTITGWVVGTDVFTTSAAHSLSIGDTVQLGGTPTMDGEYYVRTIPSTTTFTLSAIGPIGATFDVTDTTEPATLDRAYPQAASTWWFARPGDSIFSFQHRTQSNRVCTTCHVSHGSNAAMTGPYSSTVAYPNGLESDSSRLLKIDNRGTCQACHDPSSTVPTGTYTNLPRITLTP